MYSVVARYAGGGWTVFAGAKGAVPVTARYDLRSRWGVAGITGASSAERVAILFDGEYTDVPVKSGYFAWIRADVVPGLYPRLVGP